MNFFLGSEALYSSARATSLSFGRDLESLCKVTSITSGCQNSWRKAEFQCTVTYGIFVKCRVTTFQIVPQIGEHSKKQNDSWAQMSLG